MLLFLLTPRCLGEEEWWKENELIEPADSRTPVCTSRDSKIWWKTSTTTRFHAITDRLRTNVKRYQVSQLSSISSFLFYFSNWKLSSISSLLHRILKAFGKTILFVCSDSYLLSPPNILVLYSLKWFDTLVDQQDSSHTCSSHIMLTFREFLRVRTLNFVFF